MKDIEEDLEILVSKLHPSSGTWAAYQLKKIIRKLKDMHRRGLLKSNHSVMEAICAWHLATRGYDVDVEHELGGSLVCDVYARRGGEVLIVEVETGYVPPENALDPIAYRYTRVAAKIARYSRHAQVFALATPPYHILQIPIVLVKPPERRSVKELLELKAICDSYYKNPPITLEELRQAKLAYIYIVDVDSTAVRRIDAESYLRYYIMHSPISATIFKTGAPAATSRAAEHDVMWPSECG